MLNLFQKENTKTRTLILPLTPFVRSLSDKLPEKVNKSWREFIEFRLVSHPESLIIYQATGALSVRPFPNGQRPRRSNFQRKLIPFPIL